MTYVTVYVYSFKMSRFFIHQQKLQLMDFFADFWPRNSLGFLLSSIQVMLGLLWQNDVNTCVCPEICVFVWTYLHNICMMYVWYICVCNLTDQEDLLDDDAHLSKDVDMHFPFQEGKDYGRRSSRFRWCERKDLKLFFPPNSYSGSPAVLSRSSGSTWTWWISSWVSYGTPSILWWCKDFGKKGPKKKRHDVWRSARASWRKRCVKNFERVFLVVW